MMVLHAWIHDVQALEDCKEADYKRLNDDLEDGWDPVPRLEVKERSRFM